MRIDKAVKDPKYRTGFDRNFWIWEEYKPENTYLLSADVARGDGKDHSVFHIFKLETMEIIGEYQGKLTPDLFADVIYDAGSEYGNCMVLRAQRSQTCLVALSGPWDSWQNGSLLATSLYLH